MYAHLDDNGVFDVKAFNNDCRALLYNTERNLKRRSIVGNGSIPKEKNGSAHRCSRALYRHEESSAPEDDDDDFFPFKRSKRQKVSIREEAGKKPIPEGEETSGGEKGDEMAGDDKEAENAMPQAAGPSTPKTLKRQGSGSAGNTPFCKKPPAHMKRVSVLDHLQSVVEDGLHIDNIIRLLRSYTRALGHRKGYKLACKDVMLFVRDLEENGGEDDIMEMAESYHIALTKLPAILE